MGVSLEIRKVKELFSSNITVKVVLVMLEDVNFVDYFLIFNI